MSSQLIEVPEKAAGSPEGGRYQYTTQCFLPARQAVPLVRWVVRPRCPTERFSPTPPSGPQVSPIVRGAGPAHLPGCSHAPSPRPHPPLHSGFSVRLPRLPSLSNAQKTALSASPDCPSLPSLHPVFFWCLSASQAAASLPLPWLTSCVRLCQGWIDGWALPQLCSCSGLPVVPSPPQALSPHFSLHHIFYHQGKTPRGKDVPEKQVEVGWADNERMQAAPADKDFQDSLESAV